MHIREGERNHLVGCGRLKLRQANALLNVAIGENSIQDLGVIVLDELHMIDDGQRGYLLEMIASKILTLETWIQIVGMSATLTVRNP